MRDQLTNRYCIVNADDFGASRGINRGIIQAHNNGILTSASLMVNMPAAQKAVEAARSNPGLSLGLHINFTNEGTPVIDISDVTAAKNELQRQFELFVRLTGSAPSHLDSHHNIHRLEHLEPLFVELAQRHEIFLREHSVIRYYSQFYGQWDGESHPEHICPEQLIRLLRSEVKKGLTELACHPGYRDPDFKSDYDLEREVELRSLCHADVLQAVRQENIKLINYYEAAQLDHQERARFTRICGPEQD